MSRLRLAIFNDGGGLDGGDDDVVDDDGTKAGDRRRSFRQSHSARRARGGRRGGDNDDYDCDLDASFIVVTGHRTATLTTEPHRVIPRSPPGTG